MDETDNKCKTIRIRTKNQEKNKNQIFLWPRMAEFLPCLVIYVFG